MIPLAQDEEARLQTLRDYDILDTLPEREFEDIVFLASHICATPAALVSLIDAERQWFKASVGTSFSETPREISFCAHAILQSDLFVIPDATVDPRFAENPLVIGGPKIRFYAGMPLITTNGMALGTLCVLDQEPRELMAQQKEALRALAREVVSLLELRLTRNTLKETIASSRNKEESLRESEEFNTRIIECSTDCIKVLDLEGRLLSMNAGGMAVLEICDLVPLKNSSWTDFWQGKHRDAAEQAVAGARRGAIGRFTGFFPTTQTHRPMWWDVVVSPILDRAGNPERLLAVSRDITEQKQAEVSLLAITEGTASVTGIEFFRALTRHLACTLGVRYAFAAECTDASNTAVSTLAFWAGDDFTQNITFPLRGTPCEKVVGGEVCFYPENTWSLFPEDIELKNLKIESYLGVPIHSSGGTILGHIAVLHDEPMQFKPYEISILKTFAVRAAAELERKRSEEALRQAFLEVERLKNKLHAEKIYLQEEIQAQYNYEEIVGSSHAMQVVFKNIERVAKTDSTVLITGETGTGKELVARAVHHVSNRRESALIVVNCAALPSGLIESELFGHEKGAFTGAASRRKGRFELADGGTIFLDEVGELPLETQIKLLRVLQEQEFERVGGTETLHVNVRVIAATNKDLADSVRLGAFRSDLFYRLNIFPIPLPPLRQRPEDIPLLVNCFLRKMKNRTGKRTEGITQEALELLQSYHWPGNIRELANVIERATILCDEAIVQRYHLSIASAAPIPSTENIHTLKEGERQQILKALDKTNGVVGGVHGAAKLLGLNRTTLIARMKKLGIERRISAY